jgi:hypothetical protein
MIELKERVAKALCIGQPFLGYYVARAMITELSDWLQVVLTKAIYS